MDKFNSMVRNTFWDNEMGKRVPTPDNVRAFLVEIFSVCEKHGISIEHEDGHGAFILREYNESACEWLGNACLSFEKEAE